MQKKKEEHVIVVIEATALVGKPSRPLNYCCHTCGIVRHKLTNCSKFGKMQIMFKDKGGKIVKKQV